MSCSTMESSPNCSSPSRTRGIPAPRRRGYVFALLPHKERATLDPLDEGQCEFYVLPTRVLDERCPRQQTISLSSLLRLRPTKVGYAELASVILASADEQRAA